MKVFCVIGASGSGKTTTIEKIIGELRRRGYSVASIKDIHADKFDFDAPGTNTWRHMDAGADVVVGRGKKKTAVMVDKRLEITEMLKWFNHDFLVIEGGREENFPKILAAKNIQEIDERMDGSVFAVSGVISGQNIEAVGIPIINALSDTDKLICIIESEARNV